MSGVEGPTKWQDQRRIERWHDKRMRKKGCNLGDKKLMNSSRCEASQKKGKLQAKGEDHHESSTLHHMVTLCSNDKGNILR